MARTVLTALKTITIVLAGFSAVVKVDAYKFALCPKSVDNPFFDVARDGCYAQAKALGEDVECLYIGPTVFNPDGIEQAEIVKSILNDVDGLSISVTNPEPMRPVIEQALAMGLPVVTFDSDDPSTGRASYIGTDNYFFGQQMGKVLKQLKPRGGTFAIISDPTPNIIDRENGVRDALTSDKDGLWVEISQSPTNMKGDGVLAIDQMRELGTNVPNLTAIVPVMGAPMFFEEEWKALVEDIPGVTLVVGDGLAVQLEFLSRAKVQGLVAQLPYEMGVISMTSLLALKEGKTLPDFQGTNVLEHLQIPLVLPELVVDENHLGALRIFGFTLFAIIAITAIGCAAWALKYRTHRVVKVAQPEFLVMVAVGTLVMGSAIIPLSFDDSSSAYTETRGKVMCNAIPWLAFLGFTITFSALFAKTWRINRLFHLRSGFERINVSVRDVLAPFVVLFTGNVVTLLCWTLIDPLYYERRDAEGTDAWNRVIATYGTCNADNPLPYVVVLAILNVGVLFLSNYQAYRARSIESEFAESHYIGIAVGSLLQAAAIGAPLLFVVRELPQAFYLTVVFMIFIVCMVLLVFIFAPKIAFANHYIKRSRRSQVEVIQKSMLNSRQAISERSNRRSSTGTSDADKRKLQNVLQNFAVSTHDEDPSPPDPTSRQTSGQSDFGPPEVSSPTKPEECAVTEDSVDTKVENPAAPPDGGRSDTSEICTEDTVSQTKATTKNQEAGSKKKKRRERKKDVEVSFEEETKE